MASTGAIFSSKYHKTQLNPWPNILASSVVKYSRLLPVQGRWSHLKTTQALLGVLQTPETKVS